MARTILVVDDEHNMRWVLERALAKAGYDVLTAERGDRGLQMFARHRVDLVLLDLKMPGMDGLAVLRELRQLHKDVPILLLTAYATVPTAVEALQLGATDYLRKPFDLETVLSQIGRYLTRHVEEGLPQENARITADFDDFVGAAPALAAALSAARTAAQTDYTVLIQGEPGTGRRHMARLIHASAPATAGGRLECVDCANMPKALLEQTLLDEAFDEQTDRLWQQALGGSLLLASAEALDEGFVESLIRHLDCYLRTPQRPHGLRLLLTADSPVADGWSAILSKALTVQLPPLRTRLEDLPLLLVHFSPRTKWSREARAYLEAYTWPGNVTELRRVVQQAAYLAGEEPVQSHHLPSHLTTSNVVVPGTFMLPLEGVDLEELEQNLIRQALVMTQNNKSQTARLLGLSRATLLYRLDKYAIEDVG